VVGPLAFGTNELPDETKVELDVCVLPKPARAEVPPPGGRSPYDLVCVEDVEFPGFQKYSEARGSISKVPTYGSKRVVKELLAAGVDVLTVD
jgi:hypothetical protein